ncbi:uncharacterized protein [Argopecten irradians]|uniref:uncharacterized protein n=1 Tax=Argopecten irradians TaxID=31199 RepID=UPI00371F6422
MAITKKKCFDIVLRILLSTPLHWMNVFFFMSDNNFIRNNDLFTCMIFISILTIFQENITEYTTRVCNFCKKHGIKRVLVLIIAMIVISVGLLWLVSTCMAGFAHGLDRFRTLYDDPFKGTFSINRPKYIQDMPHKGLCSETHFTYYDLNHSILEKECMQTDSITSYVTRKTYKVMKFEDIKLPCDLPLFTVDNDLFVWTFGNNLNRSVYKTYSWMSDSSLHLGNGFKYGTYTCWLQTITPYTDYLSVVRQELTSITLEPFPVLLSTVYAPIGSLIELSYPRIHMDVDIHNAHLSFNHDFHNSGNPSIDSNSLSLLGCTPSTYIVSVLIYGSKFESGHPCYRGPYRWTRQTSYTGYTAALVSSIAPNSYGLRSLQITRHEYNVDKGETESVLYETGMFFLIKPTSLFNALFLGGWYDINRESSTIEVNDNDIRTVKLMTSDDVYDRVTESAILVSILRTLFELYVCIQLLKCWYLRCVAHFLTKYLLLPFKRLILKEKPCFEQIRRKKHDVMILCSDGALDISTAECVANVLEASELKTCLVHRDLNHLGNKYKTTVYHDAMKDDAMKESSNIVIIFSESMLQDQFLLNFAVHEFVRSL